MRGKKKPKTMKKLPWWVGLVLLLGILAAWIGRQTPERVTPQPSGTPTASMTENGAPTQEVLTVRFLDVGQGDSILLTCGDESMLIDGGPVEQGQFLVSRLSRLDIDALTYVVNTHPDEDHCGGLAGVLARYPVQHVYSPVTEHSTRAFENMVKYAAEQGRELEIPQTGEGWSLGAAHVQVLGPVQDYEDSNNKSLVLRVRYGQISFLFTGDMEQRAEEDLLDAGIDVHADVLKVGHHGSETASSQRFLEAVNGSTAVICVGEDNDYGHPHTSVLERLEELGVRVYRTDTLGEIILTTDGSTLRITTDPTSRQPATDDAAYIGNKNSMVLHDASCAKLPNEDNRVYFDSIEDAEALGYQRHTCIR